MARSYEEAEQRIGIALRTQDQYLDLSNLQLQRVPPEIGQLTQLQGLHLDGNQLTALPPEMGLLTQLQGLDLDGNQLTALPSGIGQLTQLRKLDLDGNHLTALPPEIGRLSQLQWLHLDGNQLNALPPEIGQLTQLRKLDLGGNQLAALPSEIGQLTQLRKLDLHGNQLMELPPEIGRLTRLQVLNLEGNQLIELPPKIGQLIQLQVLNLNGNQLTVLPPEIGRLTQLPGLHLSGNRLTALPVEIGRLTQLQVLNLEGNQLTAIPVEIGQLTQLQVLDLEGNRLTALPVEIGQLTQLPHFRDRSAAYRYLSAIGLVEGARVDSKIHDTTVPLDILEQGASSQFDVTVVMFRMVDVPDETISWMLKHGALRQPVLVALTETRVRFVGDLMQHEESAKEAVDLLDLAAASTAAVELFIAMERACVPWGLEVRRPKVNVKPGSVVLEFDQTIFAPITTFLALVAASMDAASLTAASSVLAMAPQFLDRWQKYQLRQNEVERQSSDLQRAHDQPERSSDGSSAVHAAPAAPPGIGSMSVAGRIPAHVVKRAAELAKLPLDFANHLANRLLGPVGALFRRGIRIRVERRDLPDYPAR